MANPWEMNWGAAPEEEKKQETPANPWEMQWQSDEAPVDAPVEEVQEEPKDQSYTGMILPMSVDKDGNKSFDSNAGLLGGIKRMVMLPGEVYSGEVDINSEEGKDRANEFALGMLGGKTIPTPKAAPQLLAGSRGFHPIKKAIIGPVDDAAVIRQRVEDFRAIGSEPTVGMVSGSNRAALKEQALRPTSAGQKYIEPRINQTFEAQGNEFGRAVDDLAARTNPTAKTSSKQEVGEMVQGSMQAAKDAAFGRSNDLYDDVSKLTTGTPAAGDSTRQYLKTLTESKKMMGASEKLNKGQFVDQTIQQAKAIVADVDKGISFEKLKEARTAIGALANDPNLDGAAKGYLEGLRKSLTSDMEATAKTAGDDALQAFRKANNQFRRNVDNVDGFGKKSVPAAVLSKNAPEEVFNYAMGKSKEGGTRLNFIRRQVERAEDGKATWDNLTASVVERMGKKVGADGAETYNPTAFLNDWGKMAPEAKDVLFKGTGRAGYRSDLDRVARIADTWKSYRAKNNHSNTASHQTVMSEMNPFDRNTLLGAVFAGPVGAATVMGGKALNFVSRGYQARLLSNPKTVNWLAGIPEAQVARGGLRGHVQKLSAIAASESPEMQEAIREYLRSIGYQEDQN